MEILQITIEVGDGQVECIKVNDEDSPEYLATQFCIKYNQNEYIKQLLTSQLREKIHQVKSNLLMNEDEMVNDEHVNNKFIHHTLSSSRSNMHFSQDVNEIVKNTVTAPRRSSPYKKQHLKQQYQQLEYNPGVRLYLKGLKKQEDRVRQYEILKVKQEQSELEGYTFKPQISARATRHHRDTQIENQLLQYGKLIQEKQEHMRMEHRMHEQQEYDFKPKINKLSQIIVQQKTCSNDENVETSSIGGTSPQRQMPMINDKFNKLYLDGMKQRERQQHIQRMSIDKDCTFQPKITTSRTPQSMQKEGNISVFDRMYHQALLQKEKAKMKEQIEVKIDENTGKPLFRPMTGRQPHYRGDSQQVDDVCNHLYLLHNQKMIKQQQLKDKQMDSIQQNSQKVHKQINETSKNIILQKQTKKLSDIFDAISMDGQSISAKAINISRLSAQLLQIFMPLFEELDKFNEKLDKDEFIDSAFQLMKTLNVTEKDAILKFQL